MAMMSSRPCSLVWSVRGSSSLAKWCKRETGVWAEAVMRSSVKKRCRVFRRESFAVHLSKGKGLGNNSCGFMARRCDCPGAHPDRVVLALSCPCSAGGGALRLQPSLYDVLSQYLQ